MLLKAFKSALNEFEERYHSTVLYIQLNVHANPKDAKHERLFLSWTEKKLNP